MRVEITMAVSPHGVSDGLGGVHKPGSTPDLPEDVAEFLIGRGQAIPAGAKVVTLTKEEAAEIEAKRAGPKKINGKKIDG